MLTRSQLTFIFFIIYVKKTKNKNILEINITGASAVDAGLIYRKRIIEVFKKNIFFEKKLTNCKFFVDNCKQIYYTKLVNNK